MDLKELWVEIWGALSEEERRSMAGWEQTISVEQSESRIADREEEQLLTGTRGEGGHLTSHYSPLPPHTHAAPGGRAG